MHLNLGSIIENAYRYFANEIAIIHDEKCLTYDELRAHVVACARYLQDRGVKPGDRVAILMPNRMCFTIAYFGILYNGAIVVPINFLSVEREIRHILDDSGATLLLAWSAYEDQARKAIDGASSCQTLLVIDETEGPLTIVNEGHPKRDIDTFDITTTRPQDTAVIMYTSGTTGQPKGAELTHLNLYSNAQYSCEKLYWSPGFPIRPLDPSDVTLAALPLFHSFGQTCVQNAALFGGATMTLMEKFEPTAALEVISRDRVTMFAGVPTMYIQLNECEYPEDCDLGSLQRCISGGAALPLEVDEEFGAQYMMPILEGYGLTETSPVATFGVIGETHVTGSIGKAIPGVEVRVVDENDIEVPVGEVGEIIIRGPNVMKGYYNRPEETAEVLRDGWLHSGDMGRMDKEGYFYIVDRKKDMIIRGGFNVYPREVEEVLYEIRAVREAAVVGVPDNQYGEEVKAFVSLNPGHVVTEEDIIDFCKGKLASNKHPRIVEIIESLPKGPTGKILRKELRNRA